MNKNRNKFMCLIVVLISMVIAAGCSNVAVNQQGCPDLNLKGMDRYVAQKAEQVDWIKKEVGKYDDLTVTYLCNSSADEAWLETSGRHAHLYIPVPEGTSDAKGLLDTAISQVMAQGGANSGGMARKEKDINIALGETIAEITIGLGDDIVQMNKENNEALVRMGEQMGAMHARTIEGFEHVWYAEKAADVIGKSQMSFYIVVAVIAAVAYLFFRHRQ